VRELEIRTWDEARAVAADAARSNLFAVRRPEEALMILATGRELGLGPMASLRGIHVVSGRPVLAADLLVAAVRRSGICDSWRVLVSTPERCEIVTRRKGEAHDEVGVWTRSDAERAGLYRKPGPWQQYPAQMLRHRCAADLVRRVYPDVTLGLYTADEIGEEPAPARVEIAEVRSVPAAPALPLPVQRLADDLESAETLDAVRAAWSDHQGALASEDADGELLRPARRLLCERVVALGLAAGTAEADALLKAREAPPEIAALERELLAASDESADPAASVAAVWRRWYPRAKRLVAPWPSQMKRLAVEAYAAALGGVPVDEAAKRLAAAMKTTPSPDGDGPRGGKSAAPSAPATEDESPAPADGPHPDSARYAADAAAWSQRVGEYPHARAVENGWAKHCLAFALEGAVVYEARLSVAADRLRSLSGGVDASVYARHLRQRGAAQPAAGRLVAA